MPSLTAHTAYTETTGETEQPSDDCSYNLVGLPDSEKDDKPDSSAKNEGAEPSRQPPLRVPGAVGAAGVVLSVV